MSRGTRRCIGGDVQERRTLRERRSRDRSRCRYFRLRREDRFALSLRKAGPVYQDDKVFSVVAHGDRAIRLSAVRTRRRCKGGVARVGGQSAGETPERRENRGGAGG